MWLELPMQLEAGWLRRKLACDVNESASHNVGFIIHGGKETPASDEIWTIWETGSGDRSSAASAM